MSTAPVSGEPLPAAGAEFVRACAVADIGESGVHRVVLGDGGPAVVVVRTGRVLHALTDRCSHQDYPLSDGEVFEGRLECALHGSLFDLATGSPDGPPATRPVPVHAVRVEDGQVMVDPLPSKAPADGAVLPE